MSFEPSSSSNSMYAFAWQAAGQELPLDIKLQREASQSPERSRDSKPKLTQMRYATVTDANENGGESKHDLLSKKNNQEEHPQDIKDKIEKMFDDSAKEVSPKKEEEGVSNTEPNNVVIKKQEEEEESIVEKDTQQGVIIVQKVELMTEEAVVIIDDEKAVDGSKNVEDVEKAVDASNNVEDGENRAEDPALTSEQNENNTEHEDSESDLIKEEAQREDEQENNKEYNPKTLPEVQSKTSGQQIETKTSIIEDDKVSNNKIPIQRQSSIKSGKTTVTATTTTNRSQKGLNNQETSQRTRNTAQKSSLSNDKRVENNREKQVKPVQITGRNKRQLPEKIVNAYIERSASKNNDNNNNSTNKPVRNQLSPLKVYTPVIPHKSENSKKSKVRSAPLNQEGQSISKPGKLEEEEDIILEKLSSYAILNKLLREKAKTEAKRKINEREMLTAIPRMYDIYCSKEASRLLEKAKLDSIRRRDSRRNMTESSPSNYRHSYDRYSNRERQNSERGDNFSEMYSKDVSMQESSLMRADSREKAEGSGERRSGPRNIRSTRKQTTALPPAIDIFKGSSRLLTSITKEKDPPKSSKITANAREKQNLESYHKRSSSVIGKDNILSTIMDNSVEAQVDPLVRKNSSFVKKQSHNKLDRLDSSAVIRQKFNIKSSKNSGYSPEIYTRIDDTEDKVMRAKRYLKKVWKDVKTSDLYPTSLDKRGVGFSKAIRPLQETPSDTPGPKYDLSYYKAVAELEKATTFKDLTLIKLCKYGESKLMDINTRRASKSKTPDVISKRKAFLPQLVATDQVSSYREEVILKEGPNGRHESNIPTNDSEKQEVLQ